MLYKKADPLVNFTDVIVKLPGIKNGAPFLIVFPDNAQLVKKLYPSPAKFVPNSISISESSNKQKPQNDPVTVPSVESICLVPAMAEILSNIIILYKV